MVILASFANGFNLFSNLLRPTVVAPESVRSRKWVQPGLIHKRPQAATAQVASLLAEPAPYLCTSSLRVDPEQDVVATSWQCVCQGKQEGLQYMQPIHASRLVEHEVDRPSTRCCYACNQAMRPNMWRTWCLLSWSQAMNPDREISSSGDHFKISLDVGLLEKVRIAKSGLGSRPGSTKNCEPLALVCLGWDSEGLYLLVGDCNSLSKSRLLTPHSLLFQVTSSELVEVAGD
ncbi:hypothetical protein F2Q70_00029240 [Brassica cretica]|uniref:Uncharacterized protein n=1 Tax=Brassica cretica TaxID=69181 RepID=A0A8S9FHU2_BRACR|nr:hypothetical protein F2Q70_00029240 [Brassica cretica]